MFPAKQPFSFSSVITLIIVIFFHYLFSSFITVPIYHSPTIRLYTIHSFICLDYILLHFFFFAFVINDMSTPLLSQQLVYSPLLCFTRFFIAVISLILHVYLRFFFSFFIKSSLTLSLLHSTFNHHFFASCYLILAFLGFTLYFLHPPRYLPPPFTCRTWSSRVCLECWPPHANHHIHI